MKKIYYLLAFAALAFASCNPLDKTYKELDAKPTAKSIAITITTSYASIDAANTGIPTNTLNTKYSDAPDSSTATVTFSLSSGFTLAADNLLAHNALTLVAADYIFPGNTTAYLTDAGAIAFLGNKYPTPVNNQLAVLTYLYFLSGATPAAGVTTTDSFIYIQGGWVKIYTVSPAQYTTVGRGTNNYFLTADLPSIPSFLNAFLLSDPVVMVSPKVGDVTYVSYKYNTTVQNVLPLTYDGTNWLPKLSLNFVKLNGVWVPDPTIYVNLPAVKNNPDFVWLQLNTTIGSSGARANVVSFGDFNTSPTASTTTWVDSEITAAMAAILLHRIPNGVIGVPYRVTYYVFPGANPVIPQSKTYKFNGSAYIFVK